MEKKSTLYALLLFGGLLAVCFTFAIVLFVSLKSATEEEHAWTSGNGPKIGVVEITGVITAARQPLADLIAFRRDPQIKAIVVRVDSPGGAVAPSQEIFHEILRTRKEKKVVVSMGTLAASGGLYVSVAGDRVVASPGTITGSIGVISEFPDVSGLMELARVRATTVKSGALKDVGSPLRPMSDAERAYFQKFTDGIYEQFLGDVAEARKIDKEQLRKIADGRVLSGKEALDAHLVDELGNLEDALEAAVKLAGATGEPVPVFAKKNQGLLRELLHDGTEGAASAIEEHVTPRGSLLLDSRLR